MPVELVESIEITPYRVLIQFNISVKVTSIDNDRFTVVTDAATPVTVVDPFADIAVNTDFNSVGKTLELFWNEGVLTPETTYILTISDLQNVLGQDISDFQVRFTTTETVNTVGDDYDYATPTTIPVSIIDHSIISSVYDDIIINPANQPFQIESIDPFDGDYYLPADYNKGRAIIVFTQEPSADSVNTTNFRVQKKAITRGPARWESVSAHISQSGTSIYIDFPSVNHYPEAATPATTVVYYTEGYEYFSKNYEYRIIVSKNVST